MWRLWITCCFIACGASAAVLYVSGGVFFFFQAEDGIRDLVRSRGLGDVYKRQLRHVLHAAILPLQDERHLRIEAAGRAGARAAVLRLSLIHI